MEPVLDNAEEVTTEAPLIPKGGIFAGLSFEEPCGSGAVWSLSSYSSCSEGLNCPCDSQGRGT